MKSSVHQGDNIGITGVKHCTDAIPILSPYLYPSLFYSTWCFVIGIDEVLVHFICLFI